MSATSRQGRASKACGVVARRVVRSPRAVGAVLATVLLAGLVAPQSASADLLPDMRIEASALSTTVTAGSQVVYRVTLVDEGVIAAGLLLDNSIRVVSTLAGGTFVGCQNPCVTNVPGPVSPGGSASFDLVGQASTSNLTFTTKIDDIDLANLDPTDDTATVTTSVLPTGTCTFEGQPVNGATACRSGYFPPGQYTFGNQVLVVPSVAGDTTPGVVGELSEVAANSTFCQTHVCAHGIAILENFSNANGYQVTDKNNPLRTVINTPKSDPCRGIGSRPCSVLQYETQAPDQWATNPQPDPVIPSCTTAGAIGSTQKLCVESVKKTTAAALQFQVLLTSDDPGMY